LTTPKDEGPRPGSSLKRGEPRETRGEAPHPIRVRAADPLSCQKLLFCSANSDVTDSPSEMRRIVSAKRNATESWRTLLHALPLSPRGMVSVTTTSSSLELLIRSIAGPEKTACVQ